MPEFTPEEIAAWEEDQPGRPLPGTAEKEEGKCGAALTKNRVLKRLRNEGKITTVRYCGQPAGYLTANPGYGPCKHHGGATPGVTKHYAIEKFNDEALNLVAIMNDETPLDPAPVELDRLMKKTRNWMHAIQAKMYELENLDVETRDFTSKAHAIVEIFERALDRATQVQQFAMKFNLDQAKVQLQVFQARIIGEAVRRAVTNSRHGLTDAQVDGILDDVRKELMEVAPTLRPQWAAEEE
jgi:hypothetical protein